MELPIIKVLIGQRRVGKSFILLQLIEYIREQKEDANIIFVNGEDMEFSHITDEKMLYEHIKKQIKPKGKNYIFIDEVQEFTNFQHVIRSLALDANNDIYITGSNAQILSGELATFLAGRYIEIPIYSLSFLEFCEFHHKENTIETLENYLQVGGLPFLIHLPNQYQHIQEYIKSIYNTIIYRDVVARKHIRNTVFLENLTLFLAANTGSLFSAKSISDYLKSQKTEISANQVSDYVQALVDAKIIHKINRYDIVGKRIFERGEKYFFQDLGIRNVICGYRLQDKAKLIENIVLNHLLFCEFSVKVGSINGLEIDFVCDKNNEKCYFQVTLELLQPDTIEREFGNLAKIKDHYPKYVISMYESFVNSYEGIQYLSLRQFLSRIF